MQVDLDVTGRHVVIIGRHAEVRQAIRRYAAAGAFVTAVIEDLLPSPVETDAVRFVPRPEDRKDLVDLLRPARLVVVVGADPRHTEDLLNLAAEADVLVTTEPAPSETGTVTLVGGGPGTSALLTVAACEALRDADVVFYDRLAPTEDLPRLAPGAELIDVGKSAYHHPISQERIGRLMIERARRGQSVVRLKGGDPFVFGRGGEELLACTASGVPTRVVPGVSSAVAVPAAAGIPVTSRGLSHCFSVISGHVPPSRDELTALVQLRGTIVILMGVANLTQIAAGLLAAGLPEDTPAAIVERGFSDSQRTTVTTVDRLSFDARRLDVTSPAVIVVGDVARLGGDLAGALPLVETAPAGRDASRRVL